MPLALQLRKFGAYALLGSAQHCPCAKRRVRAVMHIVAGIHDAILILLCSRIVDVLYSRLSPRFELLLNDEFAQLHNITTATLYQVHRIPPIV